ncbi:hypothetical protein ACH5RR_040754 [Cinchona calisaya]|uniref:Uncharacterized protein n=1 Tax=Cinchona calisaya TaxID=153742 RepID=A0ABD2XUP5_9GENT
MKSANTGQNCRLRQGSGDRQRIISGAGSGFGDFLSGLDNSSTLPTTQVTTSISTPALASVEILLAAPSTTLLRQRYARNCKIPIVVDAEPMATFIYTIEPAKQLSTPRMLVVLLLALLALPTKGLGH